MSAHEAPPARLPEGVRVLGSKPSELRKSLVAIFDQPGGGYLVVAFGIDGRKYQESAGTWRKACEIAAMASDAIANEYRKLGRERPPRVGGIIV